MQSIIFHFFSSMQFVRIFQRSKRHFLFPRFFFNLKKKSHLPSALSASKSIMQLFYKAVIGSCVLVILGTLSWVAAMMHTSKPVYDSKAGQCPDGYTVKPSSTSDGSYTCIIPDSHLSYYTSSDGSITKFTNSSGSSTAAALKFDAVDKSITFTDSMWLGTIGRCNKYNWATKNEAGASIMWDGITNSQSNSC